MTEHQIAVPVLATPCWAVFVDYDGNAPDTADQIFCATEALADEVCAKLNETPRKWANLAFVDGCEDCKSFRKRLVALISKDQIRTSIEEVFKKDVEEDEDYSEDGDE